MADTTYASVAGFIQFDPVEREVNGKSVTDITVKAIGSQKLVKITVWPDFEELSLKKGFFVAADGKFESRMGQKQDGSPVEYLNLSAKDLFVGQPAAKSERQVISSSSSSSSDETSLPF